MYNNCIYGVHYCSIAESFDIQSTSIKGFLEMNNRVLDDIHSKFVDINKELFNLWRVEVLFSWRWWLNLALTIIPWIIWMRYRRREDTIRMLFTAFVIAVVTDFLDIIGISYGLWHYDWTLLPLFPIYIPWNFSLFPVLIMFMFQTMPKVSPIIKALGFGGFSSYLMEPVFQKIGMYHNIHWSYFNSFIIYVPLYLFFFWVYKQTEKCKI